MTREEMDAAMAKNGIRPMSQFELDAMRAQRDYQEGKTFPGQHIAETPSHDFDYDDFTEEDTSGVGTLVCAVIIGALLVAFTVGVICGSVWG